MSVRLWAAMVMMLWVAPVICAENSTEQHMLPLFYTMWARYSDALESGKAERVADWFTAEAVLMEPQTRDLAGREMILTHMKATLKDRRITDSTIRPMGMDICGDRVYQFGTYSISEEIKGKPSVGYAGRFFSVWDRQPDGSWLISRLMMNGSEPLPRP